MNNATLKNIENLLKLERHERNAPHSWRIWDVLISLLTFIIITILLTGIYFKVMEFDINNYYEFMLMTLLVFKVLLRLLLVMLALDIIIYTIRYLAHRKITNKLEGKIK